MRLLWTLLKLGIAAAIIIPLGLIALSTMVGVLGALTALAFVVLRFAIVGLVCYGIIKLLFMFFGGGSKPPKRVDQPSLKPLAPVDPHYEAAMRELDRELGHTPRS